MNTYKILCAGRTSTCVAASVEDAAQAYAAGYGPGYVARPQRGGGYYPFKEGSDFDSLAPFRVTLADSVG